MQDTARNVLGMHLVPSCKYSDVPWLAFAITSDLHRPLLTAQGEHELNCDIKRKATFVQM